jgi:hypothetical protein
MSPASASATLERGLHNIDAAVRRQIGGAVLLGTGGFRLLGPAARTRLTGALREPLRAWLPAGATIRIGTLSGTDEGRLAWLAIREQETSQAHAILETGGASVQFATGQAGQSDYSVSLAVGMNRSFEKLAQHADFSVCFPFGAPDTRTEFDRCRGLILREIFGGPEAHPLRARTAQHQTPLYGLGLPWQAIFEDMDRPAIAAAELLRFGRQICAVRQLSPAEQKGAFVQKRCYLYAFQSALLTQTGYRSIHRSRATTWARGAAVSDPFFPGCGPADISVYTKKELL